MVRTALRRCECSTDVQDYKYPNCIDVSIIFKGPKGFSKLQQATDEGGSTLKLWHIQKHFSNIHEFVKYN